MQSSKNKAALVLLISNIVEILALIVIATDMFMDDFYALRELIAVIVNIGMVIIPIEFIVWIVLIIRSKKEKTAPKSAENKALPWITSASCALLVCFGIVFSQGVSTTTYFREGPEKITENGKYYLVLENKKVRISEERYEKIKPGKGYSVYYKWNKLVPYARVSAIQEGNGDLF